MTTPETLSATELLDLPKGGPRVVAIGGGSGLAQVLEAVQSYAGSVTAVVTVADDGGSSGRLTSSLVIPPPGDIRKCLLALSPEPSILRELFAYRFEAADVAGHSLGNLMLAALNDLLSADFDAAVRVAGRLIGAVGKVVPVARQSLHLQAVIDGRLVDGQAAITKSRGTVDELRLVPEDEPANPDAVLEIALADQIIIGPGSLFTSVLSAVVVPGIAEALHEALGRIVYVCNLVTQDGETLGLDAVAHVDALARIGGLDVTGTIVTHRGEISMEPPVEQVHVDEKRLAERGWETKEGDLADASAAWPQHDPIKLGRVLSGLTG